MMTTKENEWPQFEDIPDEAILIRDGLTWIDVRHVAKNAKNDHKKARNGESPIQ